MEKETVPVGKVMTASVVDTTINIVDTLPVKAPVIVEDSGNRIRDGGVATYAVTKCKTINIDLSGRRNNNSIIIMVLVSVAVIYLFVK